MNNSYMENFIISQTQLILDSGVEYEDISIRPDPIYGIIEEDFISIPKNSFYYSKEDALFRTPLEVAKYLTNIKIIDFFYSGLLSRYVINNYKDDSSIKSFPDSDIEYAKNLICEDPTSQPIKVFFKEDRDTIVKEKDLNNKARRYELYREIQHKKLEKIKKFLSRQI